MSSLLLCVLHIADRPRYYIDKCSLSEHCFFHFLRFLYFRRLIWACGYTFFFFSSRRRHTRCSRDWSSDVCSSDLGKSVWLRHTRPTFTRGLPLSVRRRVRSAPALSPAAEPRPLISTRPPAGMPGRPGETNFCSACPSPTSLQKVKMSAPTPRDSQSVRR